jgi:hypothetical protein
MSQDLKNLDIKITTRKQNLNLPHKFKLLFVAKKKSSCFYIINASYFQIINEKDISNVVRMSIYTF